MTDEEIKALQEKADKAAELEKQLAEKEKALEVERAESKKAFEKRDAAKKELEAKEARIKELEEKETLTQKEKAELEKLVESEKAKTAEIETQTKTELLASLDEGHKKIAEKLSLMDLREYVKLNGQKPSGDTSTKTKNAGDKPKPNNWQDWNKQRNK